MFLPQLCRDYSECYVHYQVWSLALVAQNWLKQDGLWKQDAEGVLFGHRR